MTERPDEESASGASEDPASDPSENPASDSDEDPASNAGWGWASDASENPASDAGWGSATDTEERAVGDASEASASDGDDGDEDDGYSMAAVFGARDEDAPPQPEIRPESLSPENALFVVLGVLLALLVVYRTVAVMTV